MPAPTGHSKYSPSKSKTWLQCYLSLKFNEVGTDEPNERAIYGTECHNIGATLICKSLKLTDYEDTRTIDDIIKESTMFDEEMMSIANGYADYVVNLYEFEKKRIGREPFVVVEQHLDMDFDSDAGGTLDCGIIAGDTLTVVDLKTGRGPVYAYDFQMNLFNPQLGLYALYFYKTFKDIYPEVNKIRLCIYQPVINNTNEFEMSLEELLNFENDILIPAVAKTKEPNPEAHPGDYCKYCAGAALCNKRSELLNQIDTSKEKLTDEEIEKLLPNLDLIIQYCTDLKDFALKKALNGHKWSGLKLVKGKGSRKIVNEAAVIKVCEEAGVDPYANKKLAGITELNKRLGKEKNKITPYLEMQEGAITLVPENDPREEINVTKEEEK